MSETKRENGEWFVGPFEGCDDLDILEFDAELGEGFEKTVCAVREAGTGREWAYKNALVLAASKELLAALDNLIELTETLNAFTDPGHDPERYAALVVAMMASRKATRKPE